MLTGCENGSTVNTSLNVESDLSGNRQMQVVISQSTFNEYFSGTQDDLNNIITTYCPSEMTWSTETMDSNYVYNFNITFSSVEDYTAKVANILGEEQNVEISCPDSVWVSGVYVNESFTSTDLLGWLSEAVVSEGLVSSSYASNIFGTGDTKVVFAGEENFTSAQIYLDKIDYEEISAINIVTDIVELGTYNRTVEFIVPEASMNSKGDAIRAYMKTVTPSGGECVENTNDGMTHFVISATQLNVDGITAFMQSLFGNDNYLMQTENVDDNFSPFVFSDYFVENISLGNYVVAGLSTNCRYIVQNSDIYKAYMASNFDYLSESESDADGFGYAGYSVLQDTYYYGSDESELSFPLLVQKEYNAFDLKVSTERTVSGDWERETKISFESIPTELEIETIISKLNSLVEPFTVEEVPETTAEAIESETYEDETDIAEEETVEEETTEEEEIEYADTKISNRMEGEKWEVTITQAGSRDALNCSTELLLKTESDVCFANTGKFYEVKKNEAYTEKVNYAVLLGNTSNGFSATYELDLGMAAQMEYCNYYDSDYVVTVDGGKLLIEGLGSNISVEYVGSYIDVVAIAFWIFVAIVVLLLIWNVLALVKNRQGKKADKMVAGNAFCMHCGTKKEEGEIFCSQCGEKFQ